MDVLRHRVAITYEAEAEDKTSEIVIQKILTNCRCPEKFRRQTRTLDGSTELAFSRHSFTL